MAPISGSLFAIDNLAQYLQNIDSDVVNQIANSLEKATQRIDDLEQNNALQAESLKELLNVSKPSLIPTHYAIRAFEKCIDWSDDKQAGFFAKLRSYPASGVVLAVKRLYPNGERVVNDLTSQIRAGEPVSDIVRDTNHLLTSFIPNAIKYLGDHQNEINPHIKTASRTFQNYAPTFVAGLRAMQRDMEMREIEEFHDAQEYLEEFQDAQEYFDTYKNPEDTGMSYWCG